MTEREKLEAIRSETNFQRNWQFVAKIKQLDLAIYNSQKPEKDPAKRVINEAVVKVAQEQRKEIIDRFQTEREDENILWGIRKTLPTKL